MRSQDPYSPKDRFGGWLVVFALIALGILLYFVLGGKSGIEYLWYRISHSDPRFLLSDLTNSINAVGQSISNSFSGFFR